MSAGASISYHHHIQLQLQQPRSYTQHAHRSSHSHTVPSSETIHNGASATALSSVPPTPAAQHWWGNNVVRAAADDSRSPSQSRIEPRSSRNSVTMATCYTSYDLSSQHHHHQQQQQHQLSATPQAQTMVASVATPAPSSRSATAASNTGVQQQQQQAPMQQQQQKDYSRPLHVDCSVEYELPNQAKPPAGVRNEPLLMIHPCYFRKIESQRRSPFVNNMPATAATTTSTTNVSTAAVRQSASSSSSAAAATAVSKRRAARGGVQQQQLQPQVSQQAAAPYHPVHYQHHQQQHQQQQQHHLHQQQHQQQQTQLWEPLPPLVPITSAAQATYLNTCKRDAALLSYTATAAAPDHWAATTAALDPDRSPDRPCEDKHLLCTGKYRQYLRAHRLHPYVTSAAIPIASTFPHQIQQVCYNV